VLSSRLRRILNEYSWPGNVRELCAYVERIYAANLPPAAPTALGWDDGYAALPGAVDPPPDRMPLGLPVRCTLAEAEAQIIRQALHSTGQNRSAAARMLNIHRSTLLRKMRLHGMA